MIEYTTRILKFAKQGEKTGWTYIEVPADLAQQLIPGNKKSFRVKGKLDNYSIEKTALLPMGEGVFILPINADMRKGIGKKEGARLKIRVEVDKQPLQINPDLISCLEDEPEAINFFNSQPKSHQQYFSKWIESAKTEETKAKRIGHTVTAMLKGLNYSEMIRSLKKDR